VDQMALARMLMGGPAETQGTAFEPVTRQQQLLNYNTMAGAEDAWRSAEGSPWKAPEPGMLAKLLMHPGTQGLLNAANFIGPGPKMPRPTMAPPDPTRTGWTFRDVGHPNKVMGRGDWRFYNQNMEKGNWLDVELPIRSMTATQEKVNPDFMAPVSTNPKPPMVLKKDGKYYIQDGHHRLTKAAQEGKQVAPVRLIDVDGTTQTDFPLLDLMRK
jgi:hypothetical protein